MPSTKRNMVVQDAKSQGLPRIFSRSYISYTSLWQEKATNRCLLRIYKFAEVRSFHLTILMIVYGKKWWYWVRILNRCKSDILFPFLHDVIVESDQSGLNTTSLKWQTWQHWGILFGLKRLMPYFPFLFDRRVIWSIKHGFSFSDIWFKSHDLIWTIIGQS